MAHLDYDVIIGHVVVGKEVLDILLRGLVGDASQLDAAIYVLLVQEVLQVDCLAVKLVIHEGLILGVGHLIQLDPP